MFYNSPVSTNSSPQPSRLAIGLLFGLAILMLSTSAWAEVPAADSAAEKTQAAATTAESKQSKSATPANPVIAITTNRGVIELELFADKAPLTVAHVLKLVDAKFYDGLIFHRVAANFVIQTGGYDKALNYREPAGTVRNESFNGLSNTKGTVAMARLDDPDSADAQFFINVRDNQRLDAQPGAPGYAVFGQVTSAWPTVVDIELVDTEPQGGMISVPVTPVIIESIRRRP